MKVTALENKKRRVCMIVMNDFVNDSRVYKEARSLVEGGFEVLVLALWEEGLPESEVQSGFHVKRIKVLSRKNKNKLALPLKFIEYFQKTLAEAVQFRADVYHSHDLAPLAICHAAARKMKAKLIYDSHELQTERNAMGRLKKFVTYLYERTYIHKTDQIIMSDGDSRCRALSKKYNLKKEIAMVMNCPDHMDATLKLEKGRSLIGLDEHAFLAIYVGAITINRGIEETIHAVAIAQDVHLALLGNGNKDYIEKIKVLVGSLGISDRVHFLKSVHPDEVIKYVRMANVGISLIKNSCLSYYFSTPTKMWEYMMAGICVVASDFPEMRNIVTQQREGPCGVVLNPDRPSELAEALRMLENDRAYCANLGQIGRRLAVERYNWSEQRNKLIDIYKTLLGIDENGTALEEQIS